MKIGCDFFIGKWYIYSIWPWHSSRVLSFYHIYAREHAFHTDRRCIYNIFAQTCAILLVFFSFFFKQYYLIINIYVHTLVIDKKENVRIHYKYCHERYFTNKSRSEYKYFVKLTSLLCRRQFSWQQQWQYRRQWTLISRARGKQV